VNRREARVVGLKSVSLWRARCGHLLDDTARGCPKGMSRPFGSQRPARLFPAVRNCVQTGSFFIVTVVIQLVHDR
jgi:hypothetical protein